MAECGEYEKVAIFGHGQCLYVHGAEIVGNTRLIGCEGLVRELRVDRGELALLGYVLVEMWLDSGQECVGGCALREELDRLIGDGGNGGEPEFRVLVGEETCLARICGDDVCVARLRVRPPNVDGVDPIFDRRRLVAFVDELRKAWILRVLRSRLVREGVARSGERHGREQRHEGLERELHECPER